jgi:hypothetical protein
MVSNLIAGCTTAPPAIRELGRHHPSQYSRKGDVDVALPGRLGYVSAAQNAACSSSTQSSGGLPWKTDGSGGTIDSRS